MLMKPSSLDDKKININSDLFPENNLQNKMKNTNSKEPFYQDNSLLLFEINDFESFLEQCSDYESLDDMNLYQETFLNINNENEKLLNSNENLTCTNSIKPSFENSIDQMNDKINIDFNEMNKNNPNPIQFPFIHSSYFQSFINDNQFHNYNCFQFNNFSYNKSSMAFPPQFNNDLTHQKTRKRRGTGDEALKRHPNDDFKFDNKPCYIFLSTISKKFFRSKCTFGIINRVANIIEHLNPNITKRTRMEKRRKSVLLCWFHYNWFKIIKMREQIYEQLTLEENKNNIFL